MPILSYREVVIGTPWRWSKNVPPSMHGWMFQPKKNWGEAGREPPIGHEIAWNFWMGQVFNIQISSVLGANLALGDRKLFFVNNCSKKRIKEVAIQIFLWSKNRENSSISQFSIKSQICDQINDCSQLSLRCITFKYVAQNWSCQNFWSNFFAWTLAISVTSRGSNVGVLG